MCLSCTCNFILFFLTLLKQDQNQKLGERFQNHPVCHLLSSCIPVFLVSHFLLSSSSLKGFCVSVTEMTAHPPVPFIYVQWGREKHKLPPCVLSVLCLLHALLWFRIGWNDTNTATIKHHKLCRDDKANTGDQKDWQVLLSLPSVRAAPANEDVFLVLSKDYF